MIGLFLDDVRFPKDVAKYAKSVGVLPDIYIDGKIEWFIVRSYHEFAHWIKTNGIPEMVSFDHDPGYECALFLAKECKERGQGLPAWTVHSMNPVGAARIRNYLISLK